MGKRIESESLTCQEIKYWIDNKFELALQLRQVLIIINGLRFLVY